MDKLRGESMSEYICKDDLIKEIEKQYCYPCKEIIRAAFIDGCEICLVDEMKDKIKNFPAADVEEIIHGNIVFKKRYRGGYKYKNCPKCGNEILIEKPINLNMPYCSKCGKAVDDLSAKRCAYCGAKMDKE